MTNLARTKSAQPVGKPGRNQQRLEGWRARLQQIAADRKLTYRAIAERALDADGLPLAHTTVRTAFVANGGVTIETLAAICDSMGVDIARILGGDSSVRLIAQPRVSLPLTSEVVAMPIVQLSDACRWAELVSSPDKYESLYFTDSATADGTMALRVTDASMMPAFKPGDILIVAAGEPANGDAVVVRIEGSPFCILRHWHKERTGLRVKLKAANVDFGEQSVAINRISTFGVVRKFARDLT